MGVMSVVESRVCRSGWWASFARRVVLPRASGRRLWAGRILEVGGGAGAMADGLLVDHPAVEHLELVDVDPGMLATARRRLARHGSRAGVTGSACDPLPHPDGSFDAVCTWLMLHHVLTWEAMLRELHRVLRPGGELVGYDLTAAPLGRVLHGMSRSDHRLIRPAELRAELVRAGFADIRVETRVLGQFMTITARRPSPDRVVVAPAAPPGP